MPSRTRGPVMAAVAGFAVAFTLGAGPAQAGLFGLGKSKPAVIQDGVGPALAAVDQALAEGRLVDAGRFLDTAYAGGQSDPRLVLRSGELHLARGRYDDAARSFREAAAAPELKAQAQQGEGIALAQLGRSDEAIAALKAAAQKDPTLWRAWNALGVEMDRRKDWLDAEAAYAEALKAPGVGAIVFNNRGYSRLLQGRYENASTDFVAALEKDPSLAQARTNLRLSLALRGDYRRATAASGTEDRAAVLNNAGFAAVMRGDLNEAESLLQQAIDAKGASYGRAIENLQMVRALQKAEKAAVKTP
jgi:Flp pilus assembly protein TadD